MKSKKGELYVVERTSQREALKSPIRLEILEHFAVAEEATIAEIADRMGRSRDSLYYHVNTLEKVGLIIQCGTQKSGKRDEAIYKLIAPQIAIPCDSKSKSHVDSTVQTVAALFRLSEREVRAAIESGKIIEAGRKRDFYTRRNVARLNPKALAEVNRHLNEIERIIDREFKKKPSASAVARMFSITIALLPITRKGDF